MTDRELLELAAKAAGYKTIQYEDLKSNGLDVRYGIDETIWNGENYWNPLTDDGAALRLAVKLNMTVDVNHFFDRVEVRVYSGRSMFILFEESGEIYAATRRAIVRAAAAIGKEMK